jgi:acetyltransferase-like isoleucine patch superfamily enzyme
LSQATASLGSILMERMTGLRGVLSRAVKAMADLASVCDPVFIAYVLRDSADAARAHRWFRSAGAQLAAGTVVVGLERMRVEPGVIVQTGCLLHCGGQDWSTGRGHLRLGARSYVGHHCILYGAGGLDIGADVLLGPGVTVTSQGHRFDLLTVPINRQPHLLAPVHIGDGAWIGAGAVILPGVSIGAGAIVAAGAVVTDNVPDLHLVAGVPARLVRERVDAVVPSEAP